MGGNNIPLSCIVVILASFTCRIYGQACGSTLSSTTGVIESPGNYSNSLNCSWRIEAAPNMIIELNIETFNLAESGLCMSDSLTVYDGIDSVTTALLLQPSCGSSIPWPAHPTTLLSSGGIMTLVFISDSSDSSSGFRATYNQVTAREESIFAADASNGKIYKQNRFGHNFVEIPFSGLERPVAIDYDPVEEKIYITDVRTKGIGRVNLDGSGQETIASLLVSVPDGLAVDSVSRLVYWTDVGTGSYPTVSVARLDGSFRRILVKTDIESPRDIVVQPDQGYVYWSDWGSVAKIERMNGDASNRTVLVNSGLGWPNGIAIDTVGGKLYWADALLDKIERSNLDGFFRELIKQFDANVHPFGLIHRDNAIFWTDWASEGIDVADSEIQTEPSTLHVAGVPTRFHGLAFHSTDDPPINVNDCSFRGQIGGCEELCVAVPSGTSCVAVLPTFNNCPNDMFVSTRVVTLVSWSEPTVHSPSGVQVTVTSSHPSNNLNISPNDGTIQVTYSAIDELGNPARECAFNIFVSNPDQVSPVISDCPSNIQREVSFQDDLVNVTWQEPKVVDDSGEVTLTFQSHDLNGGVFAVGNTTVTYVWEDRSGNSAECNFVVLVSVKEYPPPVVIGCPDDIIETISSSDDSIYVSWEEPKAESETGEVTLRSQSHSRGVFPVGSTPVTYIWEDSVGKTSECNFLVIVEIGQACGSTLSSTSGVVESPRNYSESLNCSWSIVASPNMVIELNIETFNLKESGLCMSDSLTVYDGIDSVTTEVLLQPSCGSAIPWPAHPTTVLSSGGIMTLVFRSDSSDSSSGFRATYNQVSPREESIFAADASNGKIYKQNRFGHNFVEIPFPGLIRPVAIDYDPVEEKIYSTDVLTKRIGRVNLDGSGQETIASLLVSVPDGLAVDRVSRLVYWTDVGTGSYPTISVARLDGSFRRILVKTDIQSPRDIVVQPNQGYVYWSDWGFVAKIERMNGDGTARTVLVNSELAWPNGIAIDTVGNKLYWADAYFDKIERSNLDGTSRELIKDFDVSVHPFGLIHRDNALFWTDWVSGGIDVADSDIQTEPSTLHVGGIPTRFHGLAFHSTADPPINVNDCSFRGQMGGCEELCVAVPSGTSCVAVLPTFRNCPNDMFISTRVVTQVSWTEPTVYSPSNVQVTVTSSHPSSNLNVSPNDGTIQVTYSAIDELGNSARECAFNISVSYPDEVPPVISNCPSNIQREVSFQDDLINVTWQEPKVVDDSGTVTVTFQSHDLYGGVFPIGNTTVTYVWEDRSGNSAECNFVVTVSVKDYPPPVVFGCPEDIIKEVSTSNDFAYVSWEEPRAESETGEVTLRSQSHSRGVFPVGSTPVTYIWEDSVGKSSECNFLVVVTIALPFERMDDPSTLLFIGLGGAFILCLALVIVVGILFKCTTCSCKNSNRRSDPRLPPPYAPRPPVAKPQPEGQVWFTPPLTTFAEAPPPLSKYETAIRNSAYEDLDKNYYSRGLRLTMNDSAESFQRPLPSFPAEDDYASLRPIDVA